MNEDKKEAKVLTVDEVAAELRIGKVTTYKAIKAGTIPHLRFGKRIMIPRAAIERLLNGTTKTAA